MGFGQFADFVQDLLNEVEEFLMDELKPLALNRQGPVLGDEVAKLFVINSVLLPVDKSAENLVGVELLLLFRVVRLPRNGEFLDFLEPLIGSLDDFF